MEVIYTMLGLDSQSFKIIQSGIIPNLLPNDIILNGNSNIGFSVKKLIYSFKLCLSMLIAIIYKLTFELKTL